MEECECCKILRGGGCVYQAKEYIVELEGGWVLNHRGVGKKTYLGCLILQPKSHRVDFGDLSMKEATILGINIQRINHSLRQYWGQNYRDDPVERVYVVYFNETPFDKKVLDTKRLEASHVHLHMLVRTKKMGGGDPSNIVGWKILDEDTIKSYPPAYQCLKEDDDRVKQLMSYLKESLS